jgi:hypothetical protein
MQSLSVSLSLDNLNELSILFRDITVLIIFYEFGFQHPRNFSLIRTQPVSIIYLFEENFGISSYYVKEI